MRRKRIEDRPRGAKITRKLADTGHVGVQGGPLPGPRAFVVGKEEDAVTLDGTAERGAELVAFQRRYGLRKEIASLDLLISEVFVRAAMDSIGAALQRGINDGRKRVLGAHAAGQHFEFLQGVGGRRNRGRSQFVFRNVEAVQEPAAIEPPV